MQEARGRGGKWEFLTRGLESVEGPGHDGHSDETRNGPHCLRSRPLLRSAPHAQGLPSPGGLGRSRAGAGEGAEGAGGERGEAGAGEGNGAGGRAGQGFPGESRAERARAAGETSAQAMAAGRSWLS